MFESTPSFYQKARGGANAPVADKNNTKVRKASSYILYFIISLLISYIDLTFTVAFK